MQLVLGRRVAVDPTSIAPGDNGVFADRYTPSSAAPEVAPARPARRADGGDGRGEAEQCRQRLGAGTPALLLAAAAAAAAAAPTPRRTTSAPAPGGPPSLCADKVSRSAPRAPRDVDAAQRLRRIDVQVRAVPVGHGGRLATGWITPVSLLASMTETRPAAACCSRDAEGREIDPSVDPTGIRTGVGRRVEHRGCSIALTKVRRRCRRAPGCWPRCRRW
ncbi:MAG: hypothetical protein U1E14_16210 [Geminicoccaceae bacterium]